MLIFLALAIPLGALAVLLTTWHLSRDYEERTPTEQAFFSGRWQ